MKFLNICLSRAGADSMITPREMLRDYMTVLNILMQNPEASFDDVIGSHVTLKTADEDPDALPEETTEKSAEGAVITKKFTANDTLSGDACRTRSRPSSPTGARDTTRGARRNDPAGEGHREEAPPSYRKTRRALLEVGMPRLGRSAGPDHLAARRHHSLCRNKTTEGREAQRPADKVAGMDIPPGLPLLGSLVRGGSGVIPGKY